MTETQNKRRYPRVKVPKNALVAWKNGSQKFVSPVENLALGGSMSKPEKAWEWRLFRWSRKTAGEWISG